VDIRCQTLVTIIRGGGIKEPVPIIVMGHGVDKDCYVCWDWQGINRLR
jgi:hypothetical protein